MVTHCTRPARTGCYYRYTETGSHYWVSNPRKGNMRAWIRCAPAFKRGEWVERWLRVEIWEAIEACAGWYDHDERNPRFAMACRELTALRQEVAA